MYMTKYIHLQSAWYIDHLLAATQMPFIVVHNKSNIKWGDSVMT